MHIYVEIPPDVDNYFSDYKAPICIGKIPDQCFYFFLNKDCSLRRSSFSWNLATGSWINAHSTYFCDNFGCFVLLENVTNHKVMVKRSLINQLHFIVILAFFCVKKERERKTWLMGSTTMALPVHSSFTSLGCRG